MRLAIPEPFRQSMGWLHTWLGIALSAILFAVFWTGTLTVFDKEIDQWMKPELRIPSTEQVSLDAVVLPRLAQLELAPASTVWVGPVRDRLPAVRLYYDDAQGAAHEELLDPRTGAVIEPTDSDAGTFFFRFHFMLHLPGNLGYYLVGIAAVGMMALVISGIFIHRKFFQEFFTFRPRKQARRSFLDFHNLTAVIALPFHFLIPFSGLLILATTYFPWSMGVPFGGHLEDLSAQQLGYEERRIEPAGRPGGAIASLDRPLRQAEDIWRAEDGARSSSADWVAIFNAGDANSYIVVERYFTDRRVAIGPDQVVIAPKTGLVIDRFEPGNIHSANNWIEGLHWIQFDHWPLRWLYFLAGLAGCAMIGSGLVFWIEARIRKGRAEPVNIRAVRAMTIGSTTGIIAASGAFLIANRLLPKTLELANYHRHDLEIYVFFGTWLIAIAHAAIRDKAAWREQCIAIAALAVAAAALNWITTGDHPLAAFRASIWPVAIMDLLLLAGAACALLAARRLSPGRTAQPAGESPASRQIGEPAQ